MSNELIELLSLILENEDPEQATQIVAKIISDYQNSHVSLREEIA